MTPDTAPTTSLNLEPDGADPRGALRRLKGAVRRIGLRRREFTIISNNCFAGWIYKRYDLPYQTPTVGLFMMAEDYLRFLGDLPRHLFAQPVFIPAAASRYYDKLAGTEPRFGVYPIGLLNDEIEVHFLHYQTPEEAGEKWRRRAARCNLDRLIVKFNDQNLCTDEHVRRFDRLPYRHRLCFTAKPFPDCPSVIWLREYAGRPAIGSERRLYLRYVPMKRLLNSL